MRTLVLVLVTFLLPNSDTPQGHSSEVDYGFKSLSGTRIVVEDFDSYERGIQLDEETLKSQAIVSVKRNIPKMRVEDKSVESYIYMNIRCMPTGTGTACDVRISLKRNIMVLTEKLDPVGYGVGEVWHKGSMLVGPSSGMPERVRNTVDQLLTNFAADYYKANP